MTELERSLPGSANITVICFRDEFSSLPLFSGATFLVIEKGEETLSHWHSRSTRPAEQPAKMAYCQVNSKPFTEQSFMEVLDDEDIIILMVSAEHSCRQKVVQKLGSSLSNANYVLTFLVTWHELDSSINKPPHIEGYNTSLFANSALHATELVRSIVELITIPSLIGVDFADIKDTFLSENTLLASGSIGTGKGEHRAIMATCNALDAIDKSASYHSVFVSIFTGLDFELSEFSAVSDRIENEITDDDCILVIGVIEDPMLVDSTEIRIVIITCSYVPGTKPRFKQPPILREYTTIHDESSGDELFEIPVFLRKRSDN